MYGAVRCTVMHHMFMLLWCRIMVDSFVSSITIKLIFMKQTRLQPLSATNQQLSQLLCKTALQIQTTDYTSATAWAQLIEQIQHTYAAFKEHAAKEENILFPLLHTYEPALVAMLRDDQHYCIKYINNLCTLFSAMQHANDKQKSKLFSHKLLYRFDEFVATILQQLNEHEGMINAVLWQYFSDKELAQLAITLRIATLTAPRKRGVHFANNIINNIVPATALLSVERHATKKRYKKELAIAV